MGFEATRFLIFDVDIFPNKAVLLGMIGDPPFVDSNM